MANFNDCEESAGNLQHGTVTNRATEEAQPIAGMSDKETQRAAWVITSKDSPIMECRPHETSPATNCLSRCRAFVFVSEDAGT
jgi:hypothetical protein